MLAFFFFSGASETTADCQSRVFDVELFVLVREGKNLPRTLHCFPLITLSHWCQIPINYACVRSCGKWYCFWCFSREWEHYFHVRGRSNKTTLPSTTLLPIPPTPPHPTPLRPTPSLTCFGFAKTKCPHWSWAPVALSKPSTKLHRVPRLSVTALQLLHSCLMAKSCRPFHLVQ